MKSSKSENNLSSLAHIALNNPSANRTLPIDIKTPRSGIISRIESNNINQHNINQHNINQHNINDLNYSLYAEKTLSISRSPDDAISSFFPKRNDKWVDSNIIQRCQSCDSTFGFFLRKHHCRACGCVFCTNCCNKFMTIPESIIKKPTHDTTLKTTLTNSFRWLYGEKKELVCNQCDKKIKDLEDIKYLIKIFEYLDIETLYKMKLVSKNFRTASAHVLSKFRDIQYGDHLKKYTSWETYIIWSSRDFLLNHSVLFTVLIKSTIQYTIETSNTERIKLIELYLKNIISDKMKYYNKSCFLLLCSRKCTKLLDFDDVLEIFDYIVNTVKENDSILEFAEIKNIIVYLVKIILKINKLHMIFPIISHNMNYLFEYEDIYLDNLFVEKLFNTFFEYEAFIENMIFLVTCENNFIDNCNNIFNINSDNFLKMISKYIICRYGGTLINNIMKMNLFVNNLLHDKPYDSELPIIYPFDINYKIVQIIKRDIINSNTKPILVEAKIIDKSGYTKIIKFIIKKDKSLRKEQIVACLIDVLLYKLSNLNLQLIPSYKIIMLNKDVGLIEYVENSNTLRSISERGYSLQNYILNMNVNNKLDTIKTRFVHSLAISSAIAYIIGLGDRHLDNIMINNMGQIFHIDYGYIMNNPIKLFNMPEIKLTNDIIDFLGGNNSVYYDEFKKMIVQIYNLYRANKNILYIFFKFISDSGYMDWTQISSKLDTKLMTGMKCKDVEITLINEIDSSNSITDIFSDVCHTYKQRFFT